MTHALSMESQALALQIHAFLAELDPVAWRQERADELRAALDRLLAEGRRLRAALDEALPDPSWERVSRRLTELTRLLDDTAHRPGGLSRRADWQRLRRRLVPAYEALAIALQTHDLDVPRLRPTNYTRNLFHVGSGVVALVMLESVLGETGRAVVPGVLALAAWLLEITRHVVPGLNDTLMRIFGRLAHAHEHFRVNSGTWFLTAMFTLGLVAPVWVSAAAIGVLGVGDPLAAIVGRRFGRTPLRAGRSVEGSAAFVAGGTIAAAAALSLYHPELGLAAVLVALAAALAGAVAEVYLPRLDDNLTIPLAAASAAWLAGVVVL